MSCHQAPSALAGPDGGAVLVLVVPVQSLVNETDYFGYSMNFELVFFVFRKTFWLHTIDHDGYYQYLCLSCHIIPKTVLVL